MRDDSPILRRGLSLFLVLALSKAIVLGLRLADGESPLSTLSPSQILSLPAALWGQDLLFVLSFVAGEWLSRKLWPRGRLFTLFYVATALYSASNVPVMRMFGTPLTFPILSAAGPALLDSLRLYLTRGNLLGIGGVLSAALLFPRLFRWLFRRLLYLAWPELFTLRRLGVSAGLLLAGLSLLGIGQRPSELAGLSRNPVYALLRSTLQQRGEDPAAALPDLPALPAATPGADTSSLRPTTPSADLRPLIGAARGRDVLWIVLESTAAGYLPGYAGLAATPPSGPLADPLPTLSQLAQGGVQFDAIYAAYPESIKGLYSQLCSTVPAAHTTASHYAQARRPCDSVAARFAASGYDTAMFHSGWFAYLGMQDIVRERGFALLKDAGDIGGRYQTSFGVDENSTVEQLLAYFDARPPGQPAFVMYLPIAGHHPYRSPGPQQGRPQPFGTDSELAHYRNDLYLGDQALARLWQGLAARQRLQRMAIVVSGDHGEAFRQHPGNFGHTLFLYEENVHVPLYLIVPGITDVPPFRSPAGPRHSRAPGSVLDIGPTLLALAGIAPGGPAAPGQSGRSLLHDGEAAARGDLLWPHFLSDHALFQLGLRHGDYKFIDEPDSGRAQLYDLRRDPDEQHNLASTQPRRVEHYRAHLRAWAKRQRLLLHAAPAPSAR